MSYTYYTQEVLFNMNKKDIVKKSDHGRHGYPPTSYCTVPQFDL